VPAAFFVVVPPRDDVRGADPHLLVAARAAVLFHGARRRDRARGPSRWRIDREIERRRTLFVVG
jgi:hypothetical protein